MRCSPARPALILATILALTTLAGAPAGAVVSTIARCNPNELEICVSNFNYLHRGVQRFGAGGAEDCDEDLERFRQNIAATPRVPRPAECPARYSRATYRPKPVRPTFAQFIEYVAPMAIEVQRETGLPASLLIAQAWQESGGVSKGYRERNNPFGTMCHQSSTEDRSFHLDSERRISYRERCVGRMPSFFSFDNMMDAFWSQAYFYLHRPDIADALSSVRQVVFTRPDRNQPVSSRELIPRIRGYAQHGATNAQYHRELRLAIDNGNLEFYDRCHLRESTSI